MPVCYFERELQILRLFPAINKNDSFKYVLEQQTMDCGLTYKFRYSQILVELNLDCAFSGNLGDAQDDGIAARNNCLPLLRFFLLKL